MPQCLTFYDISRKIFYKLQNARNYSYLGYAVTHFKNLPLITRKYWTKPELQKKAGTLIYQILSSRDAGVTVNSIKSGVNSSGLFWQDPRFHKLREKVYEWEAGNSTNKEETIELKDFLSFFQEEDAKTLALLCKVFSKSCIIPDFQQFAKTVIKIYEDVSHNKMGKMADYIPQLAKADPTSWGVALCTVDGQRMSIGNAEKPFCLQSCVKPLSYAIAVSDNRSGIIHQFMGEEPSGMDFNALNLNRNDKPHNPMINAGSIVICALIEPDIPLAERFYYAIKRIRDLCGNEDVGFDNTVFLSEKEACFRNYAIAYYLMEKGCFPPKTHLETTLDLYFQLCAVTVTCESGAVAAATLAKGGVGPFFSDYQRLLRPAAVRNTLSLMHSCGMYDYSGKFAFHVGLPAKSGVAGGLLVVIPNVMGIMCWSPLLDERGNSVRGVQFCRELVKRYNFHVYDNLHHSLKKANPRELKTNLSESELELRGVMRKLYSHDDNM